MQLILVSIVLYPQNLKRSRPVDSNTGMPGNILSAWGRAGLQYPSVLGPARPGSGEGSDSEDGQEGFHARDIRDAHSATHGTLAGKTNPQCQRRWAVPEAIA